MKINQTVTIAGLKPIRVRDFLRQHDSYIRLSWIESYFKVSTDRAREIAADLVEGGYLTPHKMDLTIYAFTVAGRQFRLSKFVPRISRDKANSLVCEFLKRVESVNARDELVYRVVEVRVFGSYLGDRDDLGDVDLAVLLEPRRENSGNENISRSYQSGKSVRNIVERVMFGFTEVKQILKARSPYLSIHDAYELDRLDTPSKVIFQLAAIK